MLYSTPRLFRYEGLLRELTDLHARLTSFTFEPRPWIPRFRRRAHTAGARSSALLEGYRVDSSVAQAISEGRAPATTRAERAVAGCALAMQHVALLADDPSFAWSARLLLDLHFESCSSEPRARPGRWRTGPVWMTSPEGGAAYQAPPADDVPALMDELVSWLAADPPNQPVVVRAAMAHLHVLAIHPFADANGRLARIVQSLVLARGHSLDPGLGTVEERFARDPGRYYAVLRDVLGGRYAPEGAADPWLTFCLEAHLVQAREQLALLDAAAHRWSALTSLVGARGLPDRLAVALEQSLDEGVDRSSYATATQVASATASTDLRRVLDAGLVVRVGRARHTRYLASDDLRALVPPS